MNQPINALQGDCWIVFIPPESEQAKEDHFTTIEERLARQYRTIAPYLRADDPLCAKVLNAGLNPGRFETYKVLFPFFREASVFGLPRVPGKLRSWLAPALFAGFEFGKHFPVKAEGTIESHETQALDELQQLAASLGGSDADFWGVSTAYDKIALQRSGAADDNFLDELFSAVTDALFAGLAAATTARRDSSLVDLVAGLACDFTDDKLPLHARALVRSLRLAQGRSVLELLRHPLSKVAVENDTGTPLHRETLLPFFDQQLRELDVKQESECPAEDLDIVRWVAAGLRFGERIRAEHPEVLDQIFRETAHPNLEVRRRLVQYALSRAGSADALDLADQILIWYEALFDERHPSYYGQALDRVARCADIAIWIAWLR